MLRKTFAVATIAAAGIASAAISTSNDNFNAATDEIVVVSSPASTPSSGPFAPDNLSEEQASSPVIPVAHAATIAPAYQRSVYVGNYPIDYTAYELWSGKRGDGVQLHSGRANWTDWSTSLEWLIGLWSGVNRTIFWTIPLIPQGTSLEEASRGKYNAYYVEAARDLAYSFPNTQKIYIRTGWEFNGDWQPWAARGKEAAYRGAYRQFVASFRSVSSRFVFEWTPNIGDLGMNPENAYPGDDVINIIGMDFYYNHQWDSADGVKAFAWKRDEKYGLAWHQAFAKRHKKATAYAEWGVSRDSDAAYVQAAAQWFDRHNIVYASYWNSNAAYRGKLSANQYPAVSKAYRKFVLK